MRFPGCNSGLQCIDQDSVYGMLHVLVRLKSVFYASMYAEFLTGLLDYSRMAWGKGGLLVRHLRQGARAYNRLPVRPQLVRVSTPALVREIPRRLRIQGFVTSGAQDLLPLP